MSEIAARRKCLFAFDRNGYVDHIWNYVFEAMGGHFKAEIAKANGYLAPVFPCENHVERLIQSMLPGWIEVAGTKGRFRRAEVIEEAIHRVESQAHRRWTDAVNLVAKQIGVPVTQLALPDQQSVETLFFVRVRANCTAALGE